MAAATAHCNIERIQHNIRIMYDHLGKDPVGVDNEGNLQTGNSDDLNYSRTSIYKVCASTLQSLSVAIKNERIHPNKIIDSTSPQQLVVNFFKIPYFKVNPSRLNPEERRADRQSVNTILIITKLLIIKGYTSPLEKEDENLNFEKKKRLSLAEKISGQLL